MIERLKFLKTLKNLFKKENIENAFDLELTKFLKKIEPTEITDNLIHVTRGSCGSSLICYLLGISHIDPIIYNIKFSRFLNEFRNNLPDIDFDFPDTMRDEVFYKLKKIFCDSCNFPTCTWLRKKGLNVN